jgi:hypothetical protein
MAAVRRLLGVDPTKGGLIPRAGHQKRTPAVPHAIDLRAIIDRIAERRGGVRSIYPALDPKRTAHLIIDMQNGFMEEGAPVEVPAARGIVDNINKVSQAVRAAGGTNIFLRYTTAEGDAAWPIFLQRMGTGADAHRVVHAVGLLDAECGGCDGSGCGPAVLLHLPRVLPPQVCQVCWGG